MSTLVLDARWLNTGLGTYTLNLIRGLSQRDDIDLKLLTLPKHQEMLAKYDREVSIVDVPIYSIREQFTIASAAGAAKVLHVPHYNAPLTRKGNLLVTIHDLTHILDRAQRRTLKSWMYAQPMLRLVARRADHIFTVSEYSKRQIMDHLGINSERITVVYNCAGPHIFPEPREEAVANTNRTFSFDGAYILFVGNLKPSKNVAGLLRAFADLKRQSAVPQKLLVIGDDAAGRPAVLKMVQELGLKGSVILGARANDDQIRAAYCGADMTVLPSFEEGFGLPVLESMTCGTPVACSRSASLPEVCGPAAEYFAPHEMKSITTAMQAILLSPQRWQELSRLGAERATNFTQEEFVNRHLQVYRAFL
jgi:glycosyltransferase involved in cell wall biosynthesis